MLRHKLWQYDFYLGMAMLCLERCETHSTETAPGFSGLLPHSCPRTERSIDAPNRKLIHLGVQRE